jgi:AraC-like DNA-binding protein
MKKKFLLYFPAFLFFIPLVMPFRSELVLFPTEKKYQISAYSDTTESAGNSSSKLTKVTDSLIVFDYTLRSIRGYPYAGFMINLFGIDSFIDISSYDSVCVDIVTKQASYFEMQLKTFIENVTDINDFRTYHTMTCDVPVDINVKRYSLPKEKFRLAPWWDKWANNKFGQLAKSLPREPDYSKFFAVNFESNSGNVENEPDRFTITKIAFVKEYKRGMVALLCIVCFAAYVIIVFCIGFMFAKMKKLKKSESIPAPVTDEDIPIHIPPDVIELEARQLKDYIYKNYEKSDLTLDMVAHDVKVSPPKRVTVILQHKFNMTYPQYLNDIRIKAAQKMLAATDLPINDIGYNVGYNNIPHFNRVFREIAGSTPKEYRDNHKNPVNDLQS